ncbi:MAG TPA: SCP-2 sterol transfer family protein [Acidimicrobiia bacterium]|nr:SCP-2 sterol transfer family protein [Acidimicrobiia bacterium]
MGRYRFLSDEWFDAVEALRDKAPAAPEDVADLAVNMVVTGGPDGERALHFAAGRFDRGLVDGAPTTVTVPHRVARSLIVDLDPAAAVTAFMTGEIRVEGDLARLMELQQSVGATLAPTVEQLAFIGELRALTR